MSGASRRCLEPAHGLVPARIAESVASLSQLDGGHWSEPKPA